MTYTCSTLLAHLTQLGKPQYQKTYLRHGAFGKVLGVSSADLKIIAKDACKTYRKDLPGQHALAHELWKSGVFDAQNLAAYLFVPELLDTLQVQELIEFSQPLFCTSLLANVSPKVPNIDTMVDTWKTDLDELKSSFAFDLIAVQAKEKCISDERAKNLLDYIQANIHTAPNKTRHAMNQALIGIGIFCDQVRPYALEVAKKVGKVHVDHGDTACETPDAHSYIHKALERNKKLRRAKK